MTETQKFGIISLTKQLGAKMADQKADPEFQHMGEVYHRLSQKVNAFFQDEEKTRLWFETPNPMLGDTTPNHLILFGREAKLERWIDEQLKLNTKGD